MQGWVQVTLVWSIRVRNAMRIYAGFQNTIANAYTTHKPRVGGSIPSTATTLIDPLLRFELRGLARVPKPPHVI